MEPLLRASWCFQGFKGAFLAHFGAFGHGFRAIAWSLAAVEDSIYPCILCHRLNYGIPEPQVVLWKLHIATPTLLAGERMECTFVHTLYTLSPLYTLCIINMPSIIWLSPECNVLCMRGCPAIADPSSHLYGPPTFVAPWCLSCVRCFCLFLLSSCP